MLAKLLTFYRGLTMYRAVLYDLRFIVAGAVGLSFFSLFLPYSWIGILIQVVYIVSVCQILNRLFALAARTSTNYESPIITGIILTLIIGPLDFSWHNAAFATLAALVAIASKYVLVLGKRHIFNPAAIGVLGTALIINESASWWIGNRFLLPFVLLGGLLLVKKIRRFHLVISFLAVYLGLSFVDGLAMKENFIQVASNITSWLLSSPLLFFSFVMLVEPLTSPQNRTERVYFGAATAIFLFVFQKVLSVPYTLELSLLTGNIFARIISPDFRMSLELLKKEGLNGGTVKFWFAPLKKFAYTPGQFLEYTLSHPKPDNRGERRYFTIASAPEEKQILLTTRFSEKNSSFKSALKALKIGEEIVASNLGGDFVLPKDEKQKLVFIAGGIGITPFRAMIKYLVDQKLYRDIVLLYSNRTAPDIAFREIFDGAEKANGLRVVYTLTEKEKVPNDWKGQVGYIDPQMIKQAVPDFLERTFFVSGPEPMVEAFEKMLYEMGLPKKQVKRDYFPGYTETHQA